MASFGTDQRRTTKGIFSLIAVWLMAPIGSAQAQEEIVDLYGQLPSIRAISISPDGEHYAFIKRGPDGDFFGISNVSSKAFVGGANAGSNKARDIEFLDNENLLLYISDTVRRFGYWGKWEQSSAFVYNIKRKKLTRLLQRTRGLHTAQSGLGNIVGFDAAEKRLLMPAYGPGENARFNLFSVGIASGRGRVFSRGTEWTTDWFVSEQGEVLAREEFDEDNGEHRIYSLIADQWELIYSLQTDIPEIGVQAVSKDGKQLLFLDGHGDRVAVFAMNLASGEIEGPVVARDDADVGTIITNINRQMIGTRFDGLKAQRLFEDEMVADLHDSISQNFPDNSIRLASITTDKNKSIFHLSGMQGAGLYLLYDREENQLSRIAVEYDVEAVAEIKLIQYKARDGLPIPSVLTYPLGDMERKNLPLIVLPHGGPESHDSLQFDWLAQFLAARGYLVLQPNFRGSDGFGFAHRNSGRGKWGKEMQDDVSDGVAALIKANLADPERVCILGASYGGYAALAGGAFTPDLYRCVIAIGAVSDLPRMLHEGQDKYGEDHWVVSYWADVIGDVKAQIDRLEAVSPVNYAAAFTAPVLLIHGRDDTVVDMRQSVVMEKALKRADKPVELIRLRGEDHWLSTSETRRDALLAIDQFLGKFNPSDLH